MAVTLIWQHSYMYISIFCDNL